MPDPSHKPMITQSDELKALLAAQKPTPRWRATLHRYVRMLPDTIYEGFAGLLTAVVIVGCLLALIVSCASRVKADTLDYDRLLPALERVESSGNPTAIGDGGKALGILQIWDVVIADVNRAKGTSYTHRDAFDPAKARAICRAYLSIYCTPRRLGRQPTMEDAARIWNGGPNGFKKAATKKYWQKVKAAM